MGCCGSFIGRRPNTGSVSNPSNNQRGSDNTITKVKGLFVKKPNEANRKTNKRTVI